MTKVPRPRSRRRPDLIRSLLLTVYVLQQASYVIFSFMAARVMGASQMGVYATVQALAYVPVASISSALEPYFISEHLRNPELLRRRVAAMAVIAAVGVLIAATALPIFGLGVLGWGVLGLLSVASISCIFIPVEALRKGEGQLGSLLASRLIGLSFGSIIKLVGIWRADLLIFVAGSSIELLLIAIAVSISRPTVWSTAGSSEFNPVPVLKAHAPLILGALPSTLYMRMPVPAATLWLSTHAAGVLSMGLSAAFLVPVLFSSAMSLVHGALLKRYDEAFDCYRDMVSRILSAVFVSTAIGVVAAYFLGPLIVRTILGPSYEGLGHIGPELVLLCGIMCVGEQRQRFASIVSNHRIGAMSALVGLPAMGTGLWLSKSWGIQGMVSAIILCFLLTNFLTTFFFKDLRPWNRILIHSFRFFIYFSFVNKHFSSRQPSSA